MKSKREPRGIIYKMPSFKYKELHRLPDNYFDLFHHTWDQNSWVSLP